MAWYQDNRNKTITNNERNSVRIIDKGGKHINKLNEGPNIKMHRGSRTQGRSKDLLLLRIDFPKIKK